MRPRPILSALAMAFLLAPAPLASGTLSCPGGSLTVASPDAALNERICRVAEAGAEQLAACGLPIRAPLVILAVPEIAHGDVSCLGAYDCDRLELRFVTPAALDAALAPDSVLRDIPREALFDSLVVHELAHAALAQQPCAAPPCLAEHEYVAYTMQMQALAPEHRAIVTGAARGLDRVTEERLNEFIAVAAPDTFAAWAWTHFSRPENGCGFVARLISGEAQLGLDAY
ncbi:DUF6639 family protein [Rhodosalinus sp. FB01]|uniref:DUF6639 family protein n=1 Tax=Rhodosalinus sp. FB01 TaxID=3239194 RepID=UPI0035248CB2